MGKRNSEEDKRWPPIIDQHSLLIPKLNTWGLPILPHHHTFPSLLFFINTTFTSFHFYFLIHSTIRLPPPPLCLSCQFVTFLHAAYIHTHPHFLFFLLILVVTTGLHVILFYIPYKILGDFVFFIRILEIKFNKDKYSRIWHKALIANTNLITF